jgi:hypothetical protein
MAELSFSGELPTQVLTDLQTRSFQTTLGLIARRSQAAREYIGALPHVRQPGDLMALQLSYWTQMLDDYSAAMTESLSPFVAPAAAPQPVPAAPPVEAAPAQAA